MSVTNDDPLLTTKEAAAYLRGPSHRTLESLRLKGGGPVFVKIGRSVFYRKSALDGWPKDHERRSTSDSDKRGNAS